MSDEEFASDHAEVTLMVRTAIRDLHRQRSGNAIKMADPAGLFPDAAIRNVPPVVVDANTLLNDVLYACKHDNQPTTLISAANTGVIRLFCAKHVLEEVVEHYRRLADERHVVPEAFVSLWTKQYAPLLRVVRVVPDALLSPDEEKRIEELRLVDPDDIPSVTLALLLGGFYLSEDGPASAAVYGERRTAEELHTWREVLRAGGDAGLLGATFEATILLTGALGNGVWNLFDRITHNLPDWLRLLIVGVILAGVAFVVRGMSDERKQGARNVIAQIGQVLAAVAGEYAVAIEKLREAEPTVPSWGELAESKEPESVLVRSCLHTLARTKYSDRSAAELTGLLPDLPVAQGEAKVRDVLRSHRCFTEVYRGRWQVGTALVRLPAETPE